MCGLVGIYPFKNSNKVDVNILDKMLDKIKYRGPDASKKVCVNNVALGFNRLSIIDLKNGMQPIHSSDNQLFLICNGEIFNYIELRKMLLKRGYQFTTESDVEVLIPLYQEFGMKFLDHINGQFSIALYDGYQDKLILIRDQVGICPLFYTIYKGNVIFASEIKALLEVPGLPRKADLIGLDQLLTFPSVISPRTMFDKIYSIPPGMAYTFDRSGDQSTCKYWDYNKLIKPEMKKSDDKCFHELEQAFDRAVKLRLRSDVPVSAYLSGGLDSSLSLAFMKMHSTPSQNIKTFSINFDDNIISEGRYQKIVSDHFKTEHYSYLFNTTDIVSKLEDIIYHSETPLKETFNCASLTLSEMAKSKNIRVALAGQGADELFAGYVGFIFDSLMQRHANDDDEAKLQQKLWNMPGFVYERKYNQHTNNKLSVYADMIRQDHQRYNCLLHPIMETHVLENRSNLLRRTLIDLRLRLADHLLSGHGDRMAMANSVEVRYPFLDPDVIKIAVNLPEHLKINNGIGKYILKKVAHNRLPAEIITREKQGFAANGSPFLLRHSPEYINDIISYDTIKKQGVFDPDKVEALKKQYSDPNFVIKAPFDNDLLMPIITFTIWQNKFNCYAI